MLGAGVVHGVMARRFCGPREPVTDDATWNKASEVVSRERSGIEDGIV